MSKKEISSGAEKAETLAENSTKKTGESKTDTKNGKAVKHTAAKKQIKNGNKQTDKAKATKSVKAGSDNKQQKALAREEKRLHAKQIRAERKQRHLEKRLEHKQKRMEKASALKDARAERKEARKERRDIIKHESKEARIERKQEERAAKIEARAAKREAALADKRAKREHRLKVRAEKRASKNEKRHAPGFGGWLAAVISLGVVTLALATMFTYGWFYMGDMNVGMASIHTESLYELNSVVDNLDSDLAKAQIASSRTEQVKLLSDIAIESEVAETILERFPTDMRLTQNMTAFVNKMGDSAQTMLYSVSGGASLSDSQTATLRYMYETNQELKRIINELTSSATQNDIIAAMRSKNDSLMYTTFGDLENVNFETPKEIYDGPFAENTKKVSAKALENLEEVSAHEAEELARGYFADYDITDVKCTGETISSTLECFNITIATNDGDMQASLSKKGGKVVEFNSHKDCSDKNFSVERCIDIAEDFLTTLGFEDMKAVWTSENSTTCNLNFACEQDGVIIYSDIVKVKVCEERGIVTGMEALAYVLNHTQRQIEKPAISEQEAAESLSDGFTINSTRLCIVPSESGEKLAYELLGVYDGKTYYIYKDAITGEEIDVFTVIGTKQGRALM